MRRAWLAVLPALLLCAPAEAATTVARVGKLELRANERDGRICITLRGRGYYQGTRCGRIPRSPHRPLVIFPDAFVDHYAAAVAPSVRAAESESRRGVRKRYATFKARGFTSRFVLIPAPPSPKFVRFYGPTGRPLGIDGGLAGYITFDNETPVFEGVEAHTEPLLWPAPDEPERLITVVCADVENGTGGSAACDDRGATEIAVLGECEKPDIVGGILADGVAGVRLTLGSGAELTMAPRTLPPPFGGRRAIAGHVPSGEAVRAAAALDGAGAVVARTVVGTEPNGQPCLGEAQGDSGFGGPLVPVAPPAGAAAVAAAGGHSLVVADHGQGLCVGLDRLRARVCAPPPFDSDRPRLLRRDRTVAGVLSRDAVRVTLKLDRGRDVAVPTTDGPAYTGAWAGDLRYFAAAVPADREVTGAIVHNRHGRIIGISRRGVVRRTTTRRVVVERDGVGLAIVRRTGDAPCLTAFATELAPPPRYCISRNRGIPIDGPVYPYSASIVVPCSPRRALAYGRMAAGHAPPRVRLANGQTVRSRRIALRGEDAWFAFLPDAGVIGLRAGKQRVAVDLPAPSAQCGYSLRRGF
jgi:hypothetical protein